MGNIQLSKTAFPQTGQQIRCLVMDQDVLFAGTDAARVLDIKYPGNAMQRIDEADKMVVTREDAISWVSTPSDLSGFMGKAPSITFLTEPGLYDLILRSDQPQAKPFRRWITADLLPSLRKGELDQGEQCSKMEGAIREAIGDELTIIGTARATKGEVEIHADGSVHCLHGRMEFKPASRSHWGEEYEAYFRCPYVLRTEKTKRGSERIITSCGTVGEAVIRSTVKPSAETPAKVERVSVAPAESFSVDMAAVMGFCQRKITDMEPAEFAAFMKEFAA
ncbi:Bro-N domain-containing protein [Streptomyces sp. 769]|uniref:BRO-N domain-containing protein n=1 Tax=Streptomyces sp. 769 TaxID=1262452 RepID=UPI000B28213A|nr:Bro-N domain-containing protein [Streptomyces sp. 769]